jgi:hypothetical protein
LRILKYFVFLVFVFQIVTDSGIRKGFMVAGKTEMTGKLGSAREKVVAKVKFWLLCLGVQVRIFLVGASFLKRKSLKGLLPLFMGCFLLASADCLCAQVPDWSWTFGETLQLTTGADDNYSPAIASNENMFFAVWYKKTPSGFNIYGARIDKDGKVFDDDKGGVPICQPPADRSWDQIFPSVSWNGSNFFVVWQDRRSGKRWDIYGARVAVFERSLGILDPGGIPISVGRANYDQVGPSLSFDGENQLVVWRGKRTTSAWSIYCKFVRVTNLEVLVGEDTIRVSASSKDQASPSVIFNPDAGNYFIVWQDKRGGKFWDIYGARIGSDGMAIDPEDILISSSGFNQWGPVLSWNGKHYLVAWTASPEDFWYIYGRLFDSEGRPQNYSDILLQGDGMSKTSPAILAGETESFLVWEENPEGNSNISGAVVAPGYRIFTGEAKQISDPQQTDAAFPVLARYGQDVLVVWQAKSPEGYWGIYSASLFLAPETGQ